MSGSWPLVAAYALVWAALFGYLAWLGREQAKLRREIRELRKRLSADGEERRGYPGR
ncbi:MAG: CcmD family protein [Anaerolineae bacterium]|nr:CcmD family protein [Anaerolineae bacterium]